VSRLKVPPCGPTTGLTESFMAKTSKCESNRPRGAVPPPSRARTAVGTECEAPSTSQRAVLLLPIVARWYLVQLIRPVLSKEVAGPFWSSPMLVIQTVIRLPIHGRQRAEPLKVQDRKCGGTRRCGAGHPFCYSARDDSRGGSASCVTDVRVDRPNQPPTINCSASNLGTTGRSRAHHCGGK
jgi:hypothetical protein